jgi:hypothetical protein
MNQQPHVSFAADDAAHLYELALEHFCVSKKEGICHTCLDLKKRLEQFIGAKEVNHIRQQVKKHPYSK